VIKDRDGRNRKIIENQITQRVEEVLKGVVGKSTLNKLLYPKYKNDTKWPEDRKEKLKQRQENAPALQLIENCFGKSWILKKDVLHECYIFYVAHRKINIPF